MRISSAAGEVTRLHTMLLALAIRDHGLQQADAEDAVQSAFLTYLEVRDRYAESDAHAAILVGILRNKCRELTRDASRRSARLAAYCGTPDAARENAWIRPAPPQRPPGVVEGLIRREDRTVVYDAIRRLPRTSRVIVRLITWREMPRRTIIRRLNVNANTFDTRLRNGRLRLRRELAQSGISA